LVDFIRKATKKSLLAMLRKADRITPRLLARLFEGVLFKDEYETFSAAGGIDHGSLGGLSDDDHSKYLLVDGSRNCTGEMEFEDEVTFSNNILTDEVNEAGSSGVIVEGVTFDEGDVSGVENFSGESMDLDILTQTSATLTLSDEHYTVLCDGTSNTVTISLPAASGVSGRIYNIKAINIDNAVTIDPNGSEEIDGDATTMTLALMEVVTLQCDGSNWWII